MAIIIWDPLIKFVSGHFGDEVYYKRGNTCCSRTYKKPRNPDTDLQRSNRSSFSMAVRSWQALPPEEKEVYIKRAVHLNMSGYNLYISKYMKARRDARSCVSTKFARSCVSTEFAINTTYGHSRFRFASPSLLLRFRVASASILPLTCLLPAPESTFPGENRDILPP